MNKKLFTTRSSNPIIIKLRAVLFRSVLFALVWWALTHGAVDSWSMGLPVVALTTLISVLLLPPSTWSVLGLLRFIPFFLWQSIRGGIDVAGRALHPHLPISPGLREYPLRLPPGLPRIFMANTVSLLPGTLCAELDDSILRVHVLDETGDFIEHLKALENRLATVFECELTD